MYFIFMKTMVCILFYYLIVCYYIKCRIKQFNKYVMDGVTNKVLIKIKYLNKIFVNHNKLCLGIELYNKFCRNIYFIFIYTLIPICELFLHLALFEHILLNTRIFYIAFVFIFLISILALNIITSDINIHVSKTYTTLYNTYFCVKLHSSITNKINVR